MSRGLPQLPIDNALPAVQIAPFERLRLPAHLDGSLHRHDFPSIRKTRINATNDMDAIQAWLVAVAKTPKTFKSYLLNVERCLLWSVVERGKPLCALNNSDALAYAHFLINLEPRARWQNTGFRRRSEHGWRPFRVPMSVSSRDGAIKMLSALWDWFSTYGYVQHNPWRGIIYGFSTPEKHALAPGIATKSSVSVATPVEWTYIESALDEIKSTASEASSARARAVIYLAYFADLTLAELVSLRTSMLEILAEAPVPVWTLSVPGRAPLRREIVLVPPVQRALKRYLEWRCLTFGCSQQSKSDELLFVPVWHETCSESSLTASALAMHTKPVFKRASEVALAGGDRLAARRLAKASLRWLRHAFELRIARHGALGNWAWLLLGSWWLVPQGFRRYLHVRPKPTRDKIYEAFETLRDMWPLDDQTDALHERRF